MAERLSKFSSTYFSYANYWRPSVSLGTTMSRSRSSTITEKLGVRHKWHIIPIATCVIIAVTLVIGIYNTVIYPNSSNTLLTTTTHGTITTTSTSKAPTASSTTSSDTITTAITSVAADTTSAAVSTDVVTTTIPPICPSMLPFGDEAGDVKTQMPIKEPFNFNLWGTKTNNGLINTLTLQSVVQLKSENSNQLDVRMLFNIPVTIDWYAYYRNVSSKAEQDAISCLVKSAETGKAFVITWVNTGIKELQAFQFIVASFEQSATYIIRIYSENLPNSKSKSPVAISYGSDEVDYFYFAEAKIEDVAAQRQIFDVSKTLGDGENLTPIEEGKNCNVFIC